MLKTHRRATALGTALMTLALGGLAASAAAQERRVETTSPEEFFGFEIGTDYQLANYQQLVGYWQRLAGESDRMVLDTIGTTEEGRPQVMAIITSPENHARLDHYKEISRRLARARDVEDEAEARRLAEEGKAVVWIDGGLHATEVLGAQQLIQLVYDMTSRTDAETTRFLDDVILLAVHANPDGHDLVANWYMRLDDPGARSTRGIPRLYEKYAGHDNNRDFYFAALAETENMNRVAYREWYPQIIYNHHQTGPAGAVMFAPPFRDPPNHNIHPMMLTSLQQVGSHMHGRFVREGKGGTTMRSGASYSTWWNGGLRTTPYYHNMIGLLTETIGNPTPMTVPFVPERQLTNSDLPLPVEPGEWHFKQSIEYSQTANRAVLDFASRNRQLLLLNIWTMGRDAIEAGQRDSWDNLPREIYAAEDAVDGRGDRDDFERLLRRPDDRQARGYVIPSDQPDFNTAVKFVNALLKNGIEVERATSGFSVGGTRYPSGSFVVKTDQAFAPHVLDMFEPQDHPDDFAYPGGPPIPPYDLTGWTLAFQMDVDFDRIVDGFDGPFADVTEMTLDPPAGELSGPADAAAWLMDVRVNDAVVVVNRVLADGGRVRWLTDAVSEDDGSFPEGAWMVDASSVDRTRMEALARETGVDAVGVAAAPDGPSVALRQPRIGLLDEYGGSMSSGWTRLILEDFDFDFERVYVPRLDEGHLADDYDVILLPDIGLGGGGRGFRGSAEPAEDVLRDYGYMIGEFSEETTAPALEAFVREGGTVVAWGASSSVARPLGLPLRNALVDDDGQPLSPEEFFVPGSLLEVTLDETSPITAGMGARADVLFARNPVLEPEPGADGVEVLGRFAADTPLRSGWAWGQEHIEGLPAFFRARLGEGNVFIFTPEITFRSQPHGVFPLIFNSIFYGVGETR
ncbi:MAG: M14 family metallopeptidase [Gemmatimonadota bacterium]